MRSLKHTFRIALRTLSVSALLCAGQLAAQSIMTNSDLVLQSDAAFRAALADMGFSFEYDVLGRLVVRSPQSPYHHYVAMAGATAVAAARDATPGVRTRVLDTPANVAAHSLVFKAEDGTLLEQQLAPVPANWPRLRATLARIPGVSEITLDTNGDITVEINGRRVRGRMSYLVSATIADFPTLDAVLGRSGDFNGDGTEDYLVFYTDAPFNLMQTLYIYP